MKNVLVAAGAAIFLIGVFMAWRYYSKDEVVEEITEPEIQAEQNPEVTSPYSDDAADQPASDSTAAEVSPPPESQEEADDYLRETYEGQDKVLNEFLAHDLIIDKLAAATDAIWRGQNPAVAINFLKPGGKLDVARREGSLYLSEKNYQRYVPYLSALESMDEARLVDTYTYLKPLFEQAYGRLGNPHLGWDDLVTQTLDKLIAMEVPEGAPELSGAGKAYIFTDPELEKLPPSHKLMIRMGAKNSERIKAKLREIRKRL